MKQDTVFTVVTTKQDVGLLLLRSVMGGMIFINHGIEKIVNFEQMLTWFPDPFGIGNQFGFTVAFIADVFCSVLLMMGFKSSWVSTFLILNLGSALLFVHHFHVTEIHGELVVIYLGGLLMVLLNGPGKLSLDFFITRRK